MGAMGSWVGDSNRGLALGRRLALWLTAAHDRLTLIRLVGLLTIFWTLTSTVSFANAAGLPVSVGGKADVVILWDRVKILDDPGGRWTWTDVISKEAHFRPVAQRPMGNLGQSTHSYWLWVDLLVAEDAPSSWVSVIDYPPIDEVRLILMDPRGNVSQDVLMGDTVPPPPGVQHTRAHAATLTLIPGEHRLLLRVSGAGPRLVPWRLESPTAYTAQESNEQMFQGLMAGIKIWMVMIGLVYAYLSRQRAYVYFALTMLSMVVYDLAVQGVGRQHLWGGSTWLTANMPPLALMVFTALSALLFRAMLNMRSLAPRTGQALVVVAALALSLAALFGLGIISYRWMVGIGLLLAFVPIGLSLPVAFGQTRKGDRPSLILAVGWLILFAAMVIYALLVLGYLPANWFNLHAIQLGGLFEALSWAIALAVRSEQAKSVSVEARRERDLFLSMAHSDPLTGLNNRRGLLAGLNARLRAQASRGNESMVTCLYLLDLNGFKRVNDEVGHDGGDALLVEVGSRLTDAVRYHDMVARLGGDEFVVVASGLRDQTAVDAVERKLRSAFIEPFQVAGRHYDIGASIGRAVAGVDGPDAATLMRMADAAMYRHKQTSRPAPLDGGPDTQPSTMDTGPDTVPSGLNDLR